MTLLAHPSPDLFETWADCVREFAEERRDGSGDWQIPDFGPDRRTFEARAGTCLKHSDAHFPQQRSQADLQR